MSSAHLSEAETVLRQLDAGGRSIEDCLTDVYIAVSGRDIRPKGGFIGKWMLATNPIFPASAALMVEDMVERAFQCVVVDKHRWKTISQLMSSDEHVALGSIIDLLLTVAGTLPVAIVSALLFKIGAKKAFAIDADGPRFDRSLLGKLASGILRTEGCDQFDLSLHAARLHRAAGSRDLCCQRLARCENLCRQRGNLADLNSVGYEYIELGDMEKGDKLLEEALSVAPDDPGLIDSIAWSNYKAGRLKKAAELINQVLDREQDIIRDYSMEGMKEVLYHSVVIFRAAGEAGRAFELHQRLASLDHNRKWLPLIEEEGAQADPA